MSIDITNTVSRFFAAVDRCDWNAVQDLMTSPFHVDYSSYGGGPALEVKPEDLTGAWAKLLPFYDHIHHQTGNMIIEQEESKANVQCHGIASHFIADQPDGDIQFIIGTYDLALIRRKDGWRLSSMRFNFKYASGNASLVKVAQSRAAKQNPQTATT